MHIAFITTLSAFGGMLLLIALFSVEQKRGRRFLSRIREWLDHQVAILSSVLGQVGRYISRDIVRGTVHFLFHHTLNALRAWTRWFERHLNNLMHLNYTMASAHRSSADSDTSLAEVARHKESNALSDEEKKARKEDSIGTRL